MAKLVISQILASVAAVLLKTEFPPSIGEKQEKNYQKGWRSMEEK